MPPLTVRCPSCDRLLEIPRPEGKDSGFEFLPRLASVNCPNCGLVTAHWELDPTVTYQQFRTARKQERVGHFVLQRLLGQGSAGEVWLADDVNLNRQVALKLPRSLDPEMVGLLFEAKTAASLRHPHIVSVYEVGEEAGQVFIATEYIDGLTLRDFLTAGKPAVSRTVDLLMRIAQALHYAHQHGVVHRDVKPANILLNKEGEPYVTDFGIAKRLNAEATISSDGQVIGTARYMSPEQAAGRTKETDSRSDVYALGVMLFEMLTGEAPFRGNVRAILDQKVSHDPPSPRTYDRGLPKDLETICLKCLEREPQKRYQSALELAEELRRFSIGEPIRARPISRVERVWRWCRMRPVVAGLLASLFLSLSLGLAGVTYFWRQAAQSAAALRESLYRSRMNLTSVHLANGDAAGVREMLDFVAADPELARLRGFEWDFFDQLIAPLHFVANQGNAVGDVAVSADGDICATIGFDPQIRVWDTRDGRPVRVLAADAARFSSIDFSPTTRHLAAGSSDGSVRVWNPLQWDRAILQMHHGPPVVLVRYSADGKHLLSAGSTGAIRVWDAADAATVAEIPTGKRNGETRDVRFSPDGKRVVVAMEDGHLRVWDLERFADDQTPVDEFDTKPTLQALALSDDGALLVTGDYHGVLRTRHLKIRSSLEHKSPWGRIDDLEFLAGTHLVAVSANDGRLHFFDVDDQREIRTLNSHGLSTGTLARSANGRSLVVGNGDGSVTRVDLDGLKVPSILWHDDPVRALEVLPGGKHLLAAYETGELRRWDLNTGRSQRFGEGRTEHLARTLSLRPQGDLLAAAGTGPAVVLWNIADGSVRRELPIARTGALSLQFSPSGRRLAVATRKGPILIYDATDWDQAPIELPAPSAKVNALAWGGGNELLAVASEDNRVGLFAAPYAQEGGPSRSITLDVEPAALEFCDGGRLLAIGTTIGEIHLHNVATGAPPTVIKGHTARINVLAMLPGSRTLVSGGRDRQLKLWDVPSGELIAPLIGHTRQVFSIAVSPDGQRIFSGGLLGDIRIWSGSSK
jgi:eukaryotic-like serine/threonine-protein kinase